MTLVQKTFEKGRYRACYQVAPHQEGMRLDQFLQVYLPSFSRQQIKKYLEKNVSIEGRTPPHRPSTKVHEKDVIEMVMFKSTHEDEWWDGQKIELQETPEVVFEDENLIVISKPPFMSTHPTGKHLFNCATVYFEEKYKHTIHSLHRLDRETSGMLLLAKNPDTAKSITAQFEAGEVKKCYFLIARVKPLSIRSDEFSCSKRLGSDSTGKERVVVKSYPQDSLQGKHAHTDFTIIHREDGYALAMAFPKTGRQHQIRVHANDCGYPLVGDKIYLGGYALFQRFKDQKTSQEDHQMMGLPRHALHAFAIQVEYQNKKRLFAGNLPQDLTQWIDKNLSVSAHEIQERALALAFAYMDRK